MKALVISASIFALTAVPAMAQENGGTDTRGYISVFGGEAWAAGNSTGSVLVEGGARVAPHLMVIGNLGRFSDLHADLQPTIDQTTAALANQGVGVNGAGTIPAWYGLGGLRADIPVNTHLSPYVLGGIGAARLNPTAQFTYVSATMPDGSTPTAGMDVTSTLVSLGSYAAPPASTAFMVMLGGGVQVPVVPRWVADVGYRYSHIAADSTLSASPLNTNAITFGVGYRF